MRHKILPFVEIDLQESVDWYALQQPGLDADFLTEIRKAIKRINQHPYAYEVKYRRKGFEIRQTPIDKFPFIIAFFVDESIQTIIIFAVWHASRNPKKLKSRI